MLLESCSRSLVLTLSGLHMHVCFVPLGRQTFPAPTVLVCQPCQYSAFGLLFLCSLSIPAFINVSIPGGWIIHWWDQSPNICAKSTTIRILGISVNFLSAVIQVGAVSCKFPYYPHDFAVIFFWSVFTYFFSLQVVQFCSEAKIKFSHIEAVRRKWVIPMF